MSFSELSLATLTQKNGTRLSNEDIQNICNDVRNGMSYRDVQKKYTIGGGRLTRILKMCNVKSIVRGGWENMNPIDVHLGNVTTGGNCNTIRNSRDCNSNPSNPNVKHDNSLDSMLSKQVEAMKKNMESIKFKSFID
jgi:hypothetical protein